MPESRSIDEFLPRVATGQRAILSRVKGYIDRICLSDPEKRVAVRGGMYDCLGRTGRGAQWRCLGERPSKVVAGLRHKCAVLSHGHK